MSRFVPVGAALVATVAMAATGCYEAPELRGEAPDRVEALFNPDTGQIPLPNDVALSDGRLPLLPQAAEESAEGQFFTYLSFLSGWLADTPVEIPFSGELDESTLTGDSVRLYRMDGASLTGLDAELVYNGSAEGSVVQVVPSEPLEFGARYAVAVTKEVLGANGHAISEPLAIFFAGSRTPLVDEEGEPTLGLLSDPDQAAALEGVRQFLAPLYEGLEGDGVDREDVAMAFHWTVGGDTVATFDPDTATIPIPNTLALDPDGTFPEAATCFAGEFSVNGEFDDYLASLMGWPDTAPITLPVSGAIEEDSITDDAVQLWERPTHGEWARIDATVAYLTEATDNCTGEVFERHHLVVTPTEGMRTHHEYFAFATREIQTALGRDLLPEIPVYLAMQPHPVVDGSGNSLVSVLDDEQAQGIAGVQAVLSEAMGVLEGEGLDQTDLASVWSWFTWNDAFVAFDPAGGQVPFPNSFLIEDGTASLPIPEGTNPVMEALLEELNQRPGFSTIAPGWIPVWGELDPETVNTDSVLLAIEAQLNSELLDPDSYEVWYEPEWGHIIYDVKDPMLAGRQYVGVVTRDALGVNGRPVQQTPAFTFLKMTHELVENGESQAYALDDATAQQLESARQAYSQLFLLGSVIAPGVITRGNVATAWAFPTEDPVIGLQRARAVAQALVFSRAEQVVERACETDGGCGDDDHLVEIEDGELVDPEDSDLTLDMSNVRAFHRGGQFQTVDVQADPPADGDLVGVSVFLPVEEQTAGDCEAPFDVVIAQHGLGGHRMQAGLAHANQMAAYPSCLATVVMDFPLHGGRTPGEDLHPEQRPADSGAGFLTADLMASQLNFVQGIMDLHVLSWLIQAGGLEGLFQDLEPGEQLFGEGLGYVGQSLGGILGVPFVAMEPGVSTAVIAAAGGRLTWVLEGDEDGPSTIGGPILDAFAAMGLEEGTFDYIQAMALVQWVADWIDPLAYAPTAAEGMRRNVMFDGSDFGPVLAGTCGDTEDCPGGFMCEEVAGESDDMCVQYLQPVQVMVQMAEGDRTIVNRTTELLARALGASLDDTTFDAPHSFQLIRDPSADGYEAGLCAREQASAWISSGLAGDATLPAELTAAMCMD